MSKKEKSVLLAGVALLLIVVLLFVLILTGKGNDDVTSGDDVTSSVTSDEEDYSDILINTTLKTKSLKVQNNEDDLTFLQDENGEFYFEEYPTINLYEGFVKYLWGVTAYMGANKRITLEDGSDPTDLAQYGFDTPNSKVTITYEDGSVKYFEAGKQLPGNDGVYYVRVEGVEGIYAVTLHKGFFCDKLYFFDDTLVAMPQDAQGNYKSVTIDNIVLSGKNYPQKIVAELNEDYDNSYSAFYGSTYILTSPEKVTPDANYFGDLVYQLKQVVVNKPVVFSPTAADLTKYGFDNPRAVVSYNYNGKDITLIAGNVNGTDNYLMMDGVDAIFIIQSSYCTNWMEGSYERIRDASVFPRAFAAFKNITVSSPDGKKYEFNVVRQVDGTKLTYDIKINGKTIDVNEYQKFISNMTLAQIVEYNLNPLEEKPALTVDAVYFADSGLQSERFEFISGGTRRYVCRINGKGNTAVSSTYIEKILNDCEKLYKGESINLM